MNPKPTGNPSRWIVGGLSAAAIIVGVGMLIGDIVRKQPGRAPDDRPPAGPYGGGMPLTFVPPPMVSAAPSSSPGFAQIWRMTPTTIPLTKLPEGKPFLAYSRTIDEIRRGRYGDKDHRPLSAEEQAQLMVETKPQPDARPTEGWWQIVRLGGEDYLRAWKLPDGVRLPPAGTSGTWPLPPSAATTIGTRAVARDTTNNSTPPKVDAIVGIVLFNRPDSTDIPPGVKVEPIQIPLRGMGVGYRFTSGSYFARLDLSSVTLDKRAKEKWSSLSLPSIPEYPVMPVVGGRPGGGFGGFGGPGGRGMVGPPPVPGRSLTAPPYASPRD